MYGATASVGFVPDLVLGGVLFPAVAAVTNGGEVAGAVGDRAAMLAGGLAAALATVVAWRASTHPRLLQTWHPPTVGRL
jgi:hypothetical protein